MKKTVLISYLLFTVSQSCSMHAQPPKLKNYGSSCYVNAIIQALHATTPLTQLVPTLTFTDLIAQQFQNLVNSIQSKNQNAIDSSLFTFYSSLVPTGGFTEQPTLQGITVSEEDIELKKAIQESLEQHGKEQGKESELIITLADSLKKKPKEIKELLNKIQKMAEQQDAGEFLDSLISSLQGTTINSLNYKRISDLLFFKIKEEPYIRPQLLLTLPTYTGDAILLYKQVKGSLKIESEIDRFDDLTEMIQAHLNDEQIVQPSPIFMICLLRFGSGLNLDNHYSDVIKLSHTITVPFMLTMTKFIEGRKNTQYNLYAAINHQGPSANSGHYIAYVKHDNIWYKCNDSSITQVSSSNAQQEINKDGYILFYQHIKEEEAQEAPTETKGKGKEKLKEEMQEAVKKETERIEKAQKLLKEKLKRKEQEEKESIELAKKIAREEKEAEDQRKHQRAAEAEAGRIEALRQAGIDEELRQQEEVLRQLKQEEKEELRIREIEQSRIARPIDTDTLVRQLQQLKKALTTLKSLLIPIRSK